MGEGERHHFIDAEVRDIEQRNRGFRRSQPLEELFFAHYRLPREGEKLGIGVRAVGHHLRVLCHTGYIERLHQRMYRKVTKRVDRKYAQTA